MCGIGGVMYADPQRPVDPDVLVGMAAIQYHRGPDGFGYQVIDDRGVGFAHARSRSLTSTPSGGGNPFARPTVSI
jgi:asparagine synthase (glutamine-hydrolysing)